MVTHRGKLKSVAIQKVAIYFSYNFQQVLVLGVYLTSWYH